MISTHHSSIGRGISSELKIIFPLLIRIQYLGHTPHKREIFMPLHYIYHVRLCMWIGYVGYVTAYPFPQIFFFFFFGWCSTYSKKCKNIHWHTINLGVAHNNKVWKENFFFPMPMSNIYGDDDEKRERASNKKKSIICFSIVIQPMGEKNLSSFSEMNDSS